MRAEMAATGDIEAAYQRGFQLRCDGRYGEARAEFQRVLATNPRHLEARWQMGLIQGFEGDFDGSIATLQGAVNDYPNAVAVRYDLAMSQQMLGYEDEAVANFLEVRRLDPSHENAQKQLAYYR